jgi:glycosyltransferase involved in cell wall biosynthesis
VIDLHFDGRFIKPEHPDGISRFSLGLIQELHSMCNLTVLTCDPKVEAKLPFGVKILRVNAPTSPREFLLAKKLNGLGVQRLFSPMQTTSSFGKKYKLILTLHDLIYYRHRKPPAEFSPWVKLLWRLYHLSYYPQRLVLNGADAVVTVSETTKRQMLEHRLTKRPITVIYNASDVPRPSSLVVRSDSKDLVYMGSFIGYKNVEALIRGMALLPDHRLVCLSRISSKRLGELTQLASATGANVEFLNGVSEEQYHRALQTCKALVSASLDEGFGIPLIEAMGCGTPVVVSDLEIFREVAGADALTFDAHSPESFARQVQLLDDHYIWEEKSELGLRQSERFNWGQSAQQLLRLAESLT